MQAIMGGRNDSELAGIAQSGGAREVGSNLRATGGLQRGRSTHHRPSRPKIEQNKYQDNTNPVRNNLFLDSTGELQESVNGFVNPFGQHFFVWSGKVQQRNFRRSSEDHGTGSLPETAQDMSDGVVNGPCSRMLGGADQFIVSPVDGDSSVSIFQVPSGLFNFVSKVCGWFTLCGAV